MEDSKNERTFINLQEELESDEYTLYSSELVVPLGKDTKWQSHFIDFKEINTLLIAGATGSGKSQLLHSTIYTLMKKLTPDEISFVLIDPKRIEFKAYEGSPYLYTDIITDQDKAIETLSSIKDEMDRRFELLADSDAVDLDSYNYIYNKKLPYIFILIDELADLMLLGDTKKCEENIVKFIHMGELVGVYQIMATSRPEDAVITENISGNALQRIAFSTASQKDSEMILHESGAETLLGKGDALLSLPKYSRLVRVQTPYVSDEDIIKNVKMKK
jgi:DNA segregation ATPase FtsK/SpoIIIE, S-DNA-T family